MSTLGYYASKCDSLSLYILDYAYNETTASVSLSGKAEESTQSAKTAFDFSGYRFTQASPVIETVGR